MLKMTATCIVFLFRNQSLKFTISDFPFSDNLFISAIGIDLIPLKLGHFSLDLSPTSYWWYLTLVES
jgi:hypothetical protein